MARGHKGHKLVIKGGHTGGKKHKGGKKRRGGKGGRRKR
jgi:hypothetical protein